VVGSSKRGERECTRRNIFTSWEEEHRQVAMEQGPQQDPMVATVNVGDRSKGERRERMAGAVDVMKPELK
jgi:hypothetical protein